MNLMDLLSTDSAALQPEPDFANPGGFGGYGTFYADTTGPLNPEPSAVPVNPSAVFYLPAELSPLQKDMSEAVVHMFAAALRQELFPKQERSNISSLLSAPDDASEKSQSRAKTVSLIYDQLVTICMHPSLVVDHFISKGLLLSATKPRLSQISGKLALFDRIVDLIAEKYDTTTPAESYNLMVIAKSVRELELIEGLVIGKKLRYRNVTNGKSLYEEDAHVIKAEREESIEEEGEYKHRRHYAARREKNRKKRAPAEFTLHLITSSHLCSSFATDTPFDLMISFDSGLDLSSPGVDLLRTQRQFGTYSQSRVPLIVPVPAFSVEHLSQVISHPETELGSFSTDSEDEWRRKVLSAYVANRYCIYKKRDSDVLGENYGNGMASLQDILFGESSQPAHAPTHWLDKYTHQLSMHTPHEKLRARLEKNHLLNIGSVIEGSSNAQDTLKFEDSVCNYEGFKREMARFMNHRVDQIDALKLEAQQMVPKLREKEARRQEEIDADEDLVGENYRKLRKLNEEVTSVEKRFTRVETEHQKLHESVTEAQQMLDHIQDVLRNSSDAELEKLIEAQETSLGDLEQEKTVLTEECQAVSDEIETARAEYQQKSTNAIKMTEKLRGLKDKEASLRKKMDGPGMLILPSLAKKDELSMYEAQLRRVAEENSFLNELYSSRYEKLVKERSSMQDTPTPTLGGRSNTRISRAATPL